MFLFLLQLWSHVYRQNFHAEIDTDNLTEAFNNALRSRYLRLRQDTSVCELVQILLNVVFPEQESNYIVAVAQQTEAYRKPRYSIPDFLIDRPQCIQAACLANMSSAKEFLLADIVVQGEGKFSVTKKQGTNSKKYFVDILGGNCSCSYFSKSNIPCKHIFAIFNLFSPQWNWYDLPKHLTDSTYLTLETSVLDSNFTMENDENIILEDNKNEVDSDVEMEPLRQEIHQLPIPVTSAHKLKCLQKKAHEIFTKCRDVCYYCTDIKLLEDTISDAEKIYRKIVLSADSKNGEEGLPSFSMLAQSSKKQSIKRSKRLCRSVLTERNGGPPKKRFKSSGDPLHFAKAKGPGRPKKSRPRREKPRLPRQVSEDTKQQSLHLKKRVQGATTSSNKDIVSFCIASVDYLKGLSMH